MSDARTAVAVLCRPRLWVTAVRELARFSPRGWWRRWPPLPRPSRAYLSFRVRTAVGSEPGAGLEPGEVVAFLDWCRRMEGARRSPTAAR